MLPLAPRIPTFTTSAPRSELVARRRLVPGTGVQHVGVGVRVDVLVQAACGLTALAGVEVVRVGVGVGGGRGVLVRGLLAHLSTLAPDVLPRTPSGCRARMGVAHVTPAGARGAPAAGTLDGMQIWPGKPYPLGATFDGTGTNFALFSEVADRVELCLIDEDGTEQRIDLPEV